MNEIIKDVKLNKYDIRDISLINIAHFKINDEVISLNELLRIKELIDYCVENVRFQMELEEKK